MKRIQLTLCLLVACTMLMAQQTKSSYRGSTTTQVIGKTEVTKDLQLLVTNCGDEKLMTLKDYGALGYNNISISGKVTLDKMGKIVSTRDVVIKGAPVKIKSISGTITNSSADIQLDGKAAGLFEFTVRYVGK